MDIRQLAHRCRQIGRPHLPAAKILLPFSGLLALIWFLLRVPMKPSRVTYPCQRAAMPVAGSFLLWLTGLLISSALFRRGNQLWRRSRVALSITCLIGLLAVALLIITSPNEIVLADPQDANDPIGVAKGANPGRVVWVFDRDATDWAGPGDGFWWEPEHTDQVTVDKMMSEALQSLSGEPSDSAAWDRLIRHYNTTHNWGDLGYTTGEGITIKVNFVGTHYLWGGINTETYVMEGNPNYMNTSPQMILALLRQLVYVVGVEESDIFVGDPLCLFPEEYYLICHGEFPAVHYLDYFGGNASHPREGVPLGRDQMYWSAHPEDVIDDYFPTWYVLGKYMINFANFKSHSHAGVTMCGKNHYGSLVRIPCESGYYNMHTSLPNVSPDPGSYRAQVDLLGHDLTGGKTMLYLVDGLYSGVHPDDIEPRQWDSSPFYGDWTSSLFASQDPIAIDSVCFDFMQEEGDPRLYPQMSGADDYLHEAALANDPPSGTFYDPNHDGDIERLESLGVHEHWNNPIERLYSRNLGTGDGIELIEVFTSAGIDNNVDSTNRFELTNYPNPAYQETTIRFRLPDEQSVRLAIYSIDGRLIRSLTQERLPAGEHSLVWQGDDQSGRQAPAGAYLSRIDTETTSEISRFIMLR